MLSLVYRRAERELGNVHTVETLTKEYHSLFSPFAICLREWKNYD